jgi:hypothetical protein
MSSDAQFFLLHVQKRVETGTEHWLEQFGAEGENKISIK